MFWYIFPELGTEEAALAARQAGLLDAYTESASSNAISDSGSLGLHRISVFIIRCPAKEKKIFSIKNRRQIYPRSLDPFNIYIRQIQYTVYPVLILPIKSENFRPISKDLQA